MFLSQECGGNAFVDPSRRCLIVHKHRRDVNRRRVELEVDKTFDERETSKISSKLTFDDDEME